MVTSGSKIFGQMVQKLMDIDISTSQWHPMGFPKAKDQPNMQSKGSQNISQVHKQPLQAFPPHAAAPQASWLQPAAGQTAAPQAAAVQPATPQPTPTHPSPTQAYPPQLSDPQPAIAQPFVDAPPPLGIKAFPIYLDIYTIPPYNNIDYSLFYTIYLRCIILCISWIVQEIFTGLMINL